jgi:hypothetical protein
MLDVLIVAESGDGRRETEREVATKPRLLNRIDSSS